MLVINYSLKHLNTICIVMHVRLFDMRCVYGVGFAYIFINSKEIAEIVSVVAHVTLRISHVRIAHLK